MIGGLLKSTSSAALFAALGLFAMSGGVTPATAADLGGDCCADLEERVAELEATTVRKGNRRVSLTISGQVHTQVMAWDSGDEFAKPLSRNTATTVVARKGNSSDVYITDYTGGTGFNLTGDAKINPNLTAGFLINIGFNRGSRSHQVDQADDDANERWPNQDGSTAAGTMNDSSFVITRAAWYLDHKQVGRLTVGRASMATNAITTIDLGGAGVIASADIGYWNGSFGAAGGTVNWSDLTGGGTVNGAGSVRGNVIHYTSPTLGGFQAQASWGENDNWDAALRYAGEFSGFRLAAGVGYIWNNNGSNEQLAQIPVQNPANSTFGEERSQWKAGASILHVASGLYLTGAYVNQDNGVAGENSNNTTEDDLGNTRFYYVQGGISKNWTGLGNTTLYGEYARVDNAAYKPVDNVSGVATQGAAFSDAEVWGLGIVQAIDAASMDIYLAYRNYSSSDVDTNAGGSPDTAVEDFNIVMGGARIKF